MATRIPLPGSGGEFLQKGVESGTNLWQQMLGKGIDLGRMHQQGNQFEKQQQYQYKALEQAWNQHLQNLELHKMQEQRLAEAQKLAAQMHPYQLENLKQQAAYHQMQAQDLANKQAFWQNLLNGGNMAPQFGGEPEASPSQGPIPTAPEGFAAAPRQMGIRPPPVQQVQNGFSNVNPAQAAYLKKEFGFDPYAESPQQKDEREYQQFLRKEEHKENAKKDKLTPQTTERLQKIVDSSNQLLPVLEKLSKMSAPKHVGVFTFSPNELADYNDLVTTSLDNMLGSYGLSSTDQNNRSMRHKLERGTNESQENWHKRIKATIEEVKHNQKAADNTLKRNKVAIVGEEGGVPVFNPMTGQWENG